MIVSDTMNKELEGLGSRGVLDSRLAVLTIDFLSTRDRGQFDWLSQKGKRCIQIQQVGRRISSDLILSRCRHSKCDVLAIGGNVSLDNMSVPVQWKDCWHR